MRRLLCFSAAALLLASAAPVMAQQLADPTQPPPEARLGANGEAYTAPVRSGPQLQSVLLGSGGRRVAVIDGQTVRTGESVNGATLVQVEKDRVVLQHGRVKQVLRLYPDAGAAAKAAAHSR